MRGDLQILGLPAKHVAAAGILLLAVRILCLDGAPVHALKRQAHRTAAATVTIRDANGRPMEVRVPVRRVVVLTSDALEVIRAIRAENLVVGVNSGISRDPLFWPRLGRLPGVGKWNHPDYELIAELNPDLVIGYGNRPGPIMERKLRSLGIQVVRLDFFRVPTLKREVEILGRILDREKEAEDLSRWYRGREDLLREGLTKIRRRPRVYVESYSRYHTTGPGSGGGEMCALAGGRNIAANFSIPYPEVTPEWVVASNPQVIVKAAAIQNAYGTADSSILRRIKREIMERPAWDHISAVEQGKVHVMESSIWTGPRAIIGVGYMAKWFHPDVFRALHPGELHREYLERFQGIEYRGVFVD